MDNLDRVIADSLSAEAAPPDALVERTKRAILALERKETVRVFTLTSLVSLVSIILIFIAGLFADGVTQLLIFSYSLSVFSAFASASVMLTAKLRKYAI